MRVDRLAIFAVSVALVLVGCTGGSGPTAAPSSVPVVSASPTLAPAPTVSGAPAATATSTALITPALSTPTAAATVAPTTTPMPTATATPSPLAGVTLDAPESVPAGAQFEVGWTGPGGLSDYIAILPPGSTAWEDESYFSTRTANPGRLVAPTTDGAYELCYILGDNSIVYRQPITVEPFEGSLAAPDEVEAGTEFEVGWTGPNGPGDFVTIVAVGATRWTNEDWFGTAAANPGVLVAPVEDGAHELWYVAGRENRTMVRRPITVTPYEVTLEAPASVRANRQFKVKWTGPDGPNDYITIVATGAPVGAYGSYEYTSSGSPANLTAPAEPGSYEIRYVSDRVAIIFESIPITVE